MPHINRQPLNALRRVLIVMVFSYQCLANSERPISDQVYKLTTFPALSMVSAMVYMLDTSPTAIFFFSS